MRMCTDERARLDVGEDPREEARALDPRLDARRRRPGEVERGVVRPHPVARRERLRGRLRAADVTAVGGGGQVERCVTPSTCRYTRTNTPATTSPRTRGPLPRRPRDALRVSVAAHCRRSATRRCSASARYAIVARIAIAVVVVGVFLTWTTDEPVTLNGTQGPNNGWLVVIVAAFALGWTWSMAEARGSGSPVCSAPPWSWAGRRSRTGSTVATPRRDSVGTG